MTERPPSHPLAPDAPEESAATNVWDALAKLPSLADAPVEESWYRSRRPDPDGAPPSADDRPTTAPTPTIAGDGADEDGPNAADADEIRYHVPAPTTPPGGRTTTAPATTPARSPAPRRRRRRRRWPMWTALAVLFGLITVVAGGLVYSWILWNRVDRVDLGSLLSANSGSGTNYLIVGTDSRDGLASDVDNANVIFGDVSGQRTDTVLVLRTSGAGATMMALPRDLWVEIAGTGSEERINTAIQGGPERLVRTVQDSLGLPIHHYLEVDFAGFIDLVDAVGGVTVHFDHPAYDIASGLNILSSGPVKLDSTQALAYVRSRNYTEVIDGVEVVDTTADLGRVERQQDFMRAVLGKVGGTRNPWSLLQAAQAMSGTIRIDDRWGYWEAIRFALDMGDLDPSTVALPTFPFTTPGGAAVLGLADGAQDVLDGFR